MVWALRVGDPINFHNFFFVKNFLLLEPVLFFFCFVLFFVFRVPQSAVVHLKNKQISKNASHLNKLLDTETEKNIEKKRKKNKKRENVRQQK